ncbi:MAG: hypothetical protein V3V25_02055 [Paracoccaceae bacterium]
MDRNGNPKSESQHHHLSLVVSTPVTVGAAIEPASRSVPIEQVYAVKPKGRVVGLSEHIQEKPKASRRSMFFHGRKPSIEDDPFLKRLSKLK